MFFKEIAIVLKELFQAWQVSPSLHAQIIMGIIGILTLLGVILLTGLTFYLLGKFFARMFCRG